jgi:putative two-component system response regulator
MARRKPDRIPRYASVRSEIVSLRREVGRLRRGKQAFRHERGGTGGEDGDSAGSAAPPALSSDQLGILQHLIMAAEYRDHDTGAHLVRIGYLCALLAPACGLNDGQARQLMMAGPMHDVGKIGIPDRVLKKDGWLNRKERDIMMRHPEYGARILSGSDAPVLRLASEIALTHHECFDGSGYPRGLKGAQISLPARIVAVVDVFDALAMNRSYRQAVPMGDALGLIMEGRGSHFDPGVVDAFFSVADSILALCDRINRDEWPGAIPGIAGTAQDDPLGFYDFPLACTPGMSSDRPYQ